MQVVYHGTIAFISNQPILIPIEKRCNACLQFKDFDAYGDDKLMQDDMKTICKECRKDPKVKSFSAQLNASPGTRICTKCLKSKKFPTDFNKMQKGEDGYHFYCRQCQSDYNIQFWIDNREDCIARGKAKQSKPEYKAQRMKRYHERMDTDPYYVELRKQWSQHYYQNHTMEHRERYYRYMARKFKATVEKVNYAHILERDGWVCHICSKPIDPLAKPRSSASLDFDHLIPLNPRPGEPQGSHSTSNLKPSHKACNVRKSNKPMRALTEHDRRGPRLY